MAQKELLGTEQGFWKKSLWALIQGSSVLFSEFIFWWILFWERELYIPQADTKIQNKIIVGKLLKLQALYLLLTLHKSFILKAFSYISTLHLENTNIQYTLLDLWYYSDCILFWSLPTYGNAYAHKCIYNW